ncbi:stimulated by retinoic acid gene 8 protein homolog [Dendropsophus ebraccatus]|uniref:stimulated by retinoic acid gene 8 protein homolog n=1 Tax=Dendropsophus ebraccatus TaxID=150705 RepID=UPI003831F670
MDTTGEGGGKKGGTRQGDSGKKTVRKRKAKTRNVSTVPQLLQQLRETVFLDPNTQATKKEVLQQARQHILHLESTLDSLLKMKSHVLSEDSAPCSLEDIKVEYLQLCNSDQSGPPIELMAPGEVDPVLLYMQPDIQKDLEESVEELKLESSTESVSSPDIMDFERYLKYYTQAVDMLLENRVVSPEQVAHSMVSTAIFSLWQELRQNGKTDIYEKYLSRSGNTAPCSVTCPPDSGHASGGKRDSGAESQEATSSFLSSTPEEILLDDHLDFTAEFLDPNVNQTKSSPGLLINESPLWDSQEGGKHLYQQVYNFLRAKLSSCTQESAPQNDYETVLLRCMETFDDEDDF